MKKKKLTFLKAKDYRFINLDGLKTSVFTFFIKQF
jgi:hypothetical protein